MKTLKSLILGSLAAAGAYCASAVEPQAWFDTKIDSYTEWPTNNAALYGGMWKNDVGAVLESNALVVDADEEAPLTFEATNVKTLVGNTGEGVSISVQTKFSPVASADQLSATGNGKAALAVVAEGEGVLRYYGLAKDGTTNAWVRLSDTVDAVTNGFVAVTVSVDGSNVCYQAGELNVTNEVVLGSSTISVVELSGCGALAALSATSRVLTSVVTPQPVANASSLVYTNGVVVSSPYEVARGAMVTVVYTANPGYAFAGGAVTATAVFTADAAEVSVPQDQLPTAPQKLTGVTVNGVDAIFTPGNGWFFAGGVLSLTNEQDYVLSGTNTTGAVRVEVKAAATVTLRDLMLVGANEVSDQIRISANVRMVLAGVNTVYAPDGPASIAVHGRLTLEGSGDLVGGASVGVGARAIWMDQSTSLIMNGGTIRDYSWGANGSGVFNEHGSFTLNGGVIRDCHQTGNGGAVYNKGSFTMNGGSIVGCSAENGGAVYINKINSAVGKFTMYGGTISNCLATADGGAAYIGMANDTTCSLYGGYFAKLDSGTPFVVGSGATFKKYGVVTGFDLETVEGGKECVQVGDLYVVGTNVTANAENQLTAGTYTFCPTNVEYAAAGVAVASYRLVEKRGETEYVIGIDPAGVTVNGTDISALAGDGWTVADGVLTLTNAQPYLLAGENTAGAVRVEVTESANVTLDNMTLTGLETTNVITFASGATNATLTLVGDNTIYAANELAAINVAVGATLTLSGDGALVGGYAKSKVGRGVNVFGTLTMDGGTIRNYYSPSLGGGLFIDTTGVVTMNGGAISGNEAINNGGGVGNNGSFTMNGGMISENTALGDGGGAIYSSGTVGINGGRILKNYAAKFGGAVLSVGTVTMNGGEVAANDVGTVGYYDGGMAFDVEGKLVVNGGRIYGNRTSQYRYCIVSRGETFIYGGVFEESYYFRKGQHQSGLKGVIKLYGCECVSDPDYTPVYGYAVQSIGAAKSGWYVVAKADTVDCTSGGLTAGTYTFCPTNAEYAAAGVAVANGREAYAMGTTPETYVIGGEPTGVAINGVDAAAGAGAGWTFAGGVLSLINEQDYVLSGTNTAGAVRVEVTASADVTLDNAMLTGLETTNVLTFASGATNATLMLAGDNTIYAATNLAAVSVLSNAAVTLAGDGALVGGSASSKLGVGINVYGTLTMDGGTIRNYYSPSLGGGLFVDTTGVVTMNGGTISDNKATNYGGGVGNNGSFSMNAGGISGNQALDHDGGAIHVSGTGTAVINGGVISNNTAASFGGAVLAAGSVTMNGGEVTGNQVTRQETYFGGTAFGVYGTLIVNGGWIHDNNTEAAYNDCIVSRGTTSVYGGAFRETQYFRVGADSLKKIKLYGCECSSDPKYDPVSGYTAQSIDATKSGWYVIAKEDSVACRKDGLTAGTYTFCPTNAEYAAAGVAVAPYRLVEKHSDTEYEIVLDRMGVTVGGTDVAVGEGDGWTFANGVLSLTNAQEYVLAGTNYTDGAVRVNVTAAADVTLDSLSLIAPDSSIWQMIMFEPGATNATLSLIGDSTVYGSKEHSLFHSACAVCVKNGAKVTMRGDGALVGNASSGISGSSCVEVYGTFIMEGATIRDYYAYRGGGAVFVYWDGVFEMTGGTVTNCSVQSSGGGFLTNDHGTTIIRGGSVSGCDSDNGVAYIVSYYNTKDDAGNCDVYGCYFGHCSKKVYFNGDKITVFGCVVDKYLHDTRYHPTNCIAPGRVCVEVGNNIIIGQDVAQANAQLTGGTYTFCPTNAEYVAAGVAVADGTTITQNATTPVTWTLGMALTYPDYLGPWSSAVTNTFDAWAQTYGSRDPDGVYTNAFLLNVATNNEAAAVAAFKITSIAVTNEVVDIGLPQPYAPATSFNGAVWLQCVTNLPAAEADWKDIENGRYSEKDKSFFRLRIDFEHTLTPESFPEVPEGSKTIKLFAH